ncbi:MAG: 4-(cytidine 5'-diphospho)-2-C-methyl-D-erythritol kinase [Coriobacteriia bacterium]|nr:4-(cytidine 5'-diphospho)-2-C-methyl-D-erythritol kinase [Coriobacteriia bacterium]
MQTLTIVAPAKVNLYLGIGDLRPDGHHNVESVLQTLELADTVRLTPSDELTLSCDAALGIPAEENLAFRAARAFSKAYDVDVLLDIEVEKRIPAGAGLAGGSTDAAVVLAGLAFWAGLPLDDPLLLSVARSLGADVPFFLFGGCVLMGGRGDEFVRRLPDVDLDIVVIKPPVPVPTGQAYRAFDASPQVASGSDGLESALAGGDAAHIAEALANNMTQASIAVAPEVGESLSWLSSRPGVLGALVSGSGSSVFGVCSDAETATTLAAQAATMGLWAVATRSRHSGAHVTCEESS